MKTANETKKRLLKKGSYSFALCVIAAAVVVALNLLAGKLPATMNQVDISEQKLYTLTQETLNTLAGLDTDITFYFIGSLKNDDIIAKTLKQYEEHSSHIKVVEKDPDLYPTFVTQFTTDTVDVNSIIAVAGERKKIIPYSSMYETALDYTTYTTNTTGFDGEGQLTSAINYLTSDDTPTVYVLKGHDELALPDGLKTLIEKQNLDVQELTLLTEQKVPENCQLLIIISPSKDMSDDDFQKVKTYMDNGGNAIMATYITNKELKNFDTLLLDYGVSTDDSMIFENDASRCLAQYPMYIIPEIAYTEYTETMQDGATFVLLPQSQPIKTSAVSEDTITVSPLLKSSEESYSKKNYETMETYEYELTDDVGPFYVGAAIEKIQETTVSHMIVFGSESIFNDEVDAVVAGGNYKLMMNIISKLCDADTVSAIPSKSMSYETLVIPTNKIILWRTVTMFIVPLLFLAIGGIIWFKRRTR